jgi:hypothetical protein
MKNSTVQTFRNEIFKEQKLTIGLRKGLRSNSRGCNTVRFRVSDTRCGTYELRLLGS